MSPRVGIELGPARLRATVASAWRDRPVRTHEVPWNPLQPLEGVLALRESLGAVGSVSLAIGLGLLYVKRVELPRSGDAEREQMVALEGERFFAVHEPMVAALAPGGEVAFAVESAMLDAWTAAFATWAPVVRVDAAPVALARALGADASGEYHVDAGANEWGVVALGTGRVRVARRIPAALDETPGRELPDIRGLGGEWSAALGALMGDDASEAGTLASTERRREFRRRRLRRLVTTAMAAAAAIVFAAFAFDRSRQRTLQALEAQVTTLRGAAAPGEAALATRARLAAELSLLRRRTDGHTSALGPLAAVSNLLPGDVVILTAQATGRNWQIDGTAGDAAALVPLLDRDPRFENVRILSASSRFRDGGRTRETFSIAFRVRLGA